MLGVLISLMAVYICERENNLFSIKDSMVLIAMAVIENFGVRQLISLWRVTGFFSSLKSSKGWGKMVRKGFSNVAKTG